MPDSPRKGSHTPGSHSPRKGSHTPGSHSPRKEVQPVGDLPKPPKNFEETLLTRLSDIENAIEALKVKEETLLTRLSGIENAIEALKVKMDNPTIPLSFRDIGITPQELYGANTTFRVDNFMPYDVKQKLQDLILKQQEFTKIYGQIYGESDSKFSELFTTVHYKYISRLKKAFKMLVEYELINKVNLLYQMVPRNLYTPPDERIIEYDTISAINLARSLRSYRAPDGGSRRTRQSLPKKQNSRSKRS